MRMRTTAENYIVYVFWNDICRICILFLSAVTMIKIIIHPYPCIFPFQSRLSDNRVDQTMDVRIALSKNTSPSYLPIMYTVTEKLYTTVLSPRPNPNNHAYFKPPTPTNQSAHQSLKTYSIIKLTISYHPPPANRDGLGPRFINPALS